MLGLIFIYFIGKAFYDLAGAHKKSQWGFALLGVVSYYVASVIPSIAIIFLSEDPESVAGLGVVLSLAAGIFGCWATYRILKGQWGKPSYKNNDTLDGNLMK